MRGGGGLIVSRRRFLGVAAAGLVAASWPAAPAGARRGVRAAAYTLGGTNRVFPQGRLANGSINVRHVIRLPAPTTRWRLRVANYQCRDEVPFKGRARLTSAWFGPHAAGEGDRRTGRFVRGLQAKVAGPLDLVDGRQLATAWVTDPARQFPAGEDRVLSLGVTCSRSQTLAASPNRSFQNYAGGAASAGVASPALGFLKDSPLSVVVEYETDHAGPVGLFVGDSITDGGYTDGGVATSYADQFALQSGVPCVVHALGGAMARDFASARRDGTWGYKWGRLPLARISPDFAVISLGTNDLGGDNRGFEETRSAVEAVARRVASLGVGRIYLGRVTPRRYSEYPTRWTTADEANRRALNDWMADPGNGYAGAVRFDEALADPGDPTLLARPYDNGDRLHPNTRGHSRMAEEVATAVTP